MTPGPAISLATRPETTYIPVPTQLPTPSEMRSTVVSTWASLVPCAVVPPVPSSMDSTGLVRRILECMAYQEAPHCTLRGSREARKPLILSSRGSGESQLMEEGYGSLSGCFWNSFSAQGSSFQERSRGTQSSLFLGMNVCRKNTRKEKMRLSGKQTMAWRHGWRSRYYAVRADLSCVLIRRETSFPPCVPSSPE